ncbi:MAG: adenylyltransferase/cytidyltransferase family protein [Elusimicrobia bacterium]|nr:adenylyltransferase/cytidyltransferase family protein [Elusimicrobiota bacterium]
MALKNKKTVVFTNGCFDILHRGHVELFKKAKALGDFLVVGLNSDSSVRRIKGPKRPINGQQDRAIVLGALEYVDKIIVFSQDTPYELLKILKPDILVKGADYGGKEIIGRGFAKKTARIRLIKGKSTTKLIEKLKANLIK